MSKIHRTVGKKIIKHIRQTFIPYEELADLLKDDGEAFLEDAEERPLKRQTLWYASKKLSKMIGREVLYCRALLRVGDEHLEGYALSTKDQ